MSSKRALISERLSPAAVAMWSGDDSALVERLAENDERLLEAYVDDEASLSTGRLEEALAEQTGRAIVHPAFRGSAMTGAGVDALMDGIVKLLPAADYDGAGPVTGSVFKIERGPVGEKVAYVRMFAGTVRVRDRLAPAIKLFKATFPDVREPALVVAGGVAANRRLRDRLLISTVLTIPVVVLAMVPAWQFDYWQWLSLTLAAPVVVWGSWPFHRAAWANLRHGAATMDTLISLGTLAALGCSVYALFWGTAGMPGMTHPFELTIERTSGADNIYLEAAAGVTTFILAGRYAEQVRPAATSGSRSSN